MKETWTHGEKTQLAQYAGISKQYLNDILKQRTDASEELAEKLEKGCESFGTFISKHDWMNAKTTNSPFFG